MRGQQASASRVGPQLHTWGGLSSALSFKSTSRAWNIHYLPLSLRCGAAQSGERVACFFFFLFPSSDFWRATNWRGLSGRWRPELSDLTAVFKHSASAGPKKSLGVFFERCWTHFAPFFFFFLPPSPPSTTAAKPTWHFPKKRSNHLKEQFRITHCSINRCFISSITNKIKYTFIYLKSSFVFSCLFYPLMSHYWTVNHLRWLRPRLKGGF